MNDLKVLVGSSDFLSMIMFPAMIVSVILALLIIKFSPFINVYARAYFQVSLGFVFFRVWYSSTYTPGTIVWWGNLFWLNLFISCVVLLGAVIIAIPKKVVVTVVPRTVAQETGRIADQTERIADAATGHTQSEGKP